MWPSVANYGQVRPNPSTGSGGCPRLCATLTGMTTSDLTPLGDYLSEEQVAHQLGISLNMLRRRRTTGSVDCPPYVQVGRTVLYDPRDVAQWVNDRKCYPSRGVTTSFNPEN